MPITATLLELPRHTCSTSCAVEETTQHVLELYEDTAYRSGDETLGEGPRARYPSTAKRKGAKVDGNLRVECFLQR